MAKKQHKKTKQADKQDISFLKQLDNVDLNQTQLEEMLYTMYLIRRFERMADQLYAAGKVHGTMHLSAGQEAVAVGVGRAVDPNDYLINHHRGHGHFITKGADINLMMAEFLGKATGYCRGRGGSMHIADVEGNNLGANGIVGGGIPLAMGVGLALQMQRKKEISIGIFGDGASNEGVFHESLNMAALWDLPVLYICENNKYGMSMEVSQVSAKLPIAQRAEAYGMPWHVVDGNDILAVYAVVREAAAHVRGGKGPVLVEAQTYRYFGHSKSDRNLYRTQEEIEAWRKKDPILRYRKALIENDLLTEQKADELEEEANAVIEAAVAFAEQSPEPDISTLMDFVYA